MSAYPPIPGSPDVIDGLAAALRDEAQRIGSAQDRLLALRSRARWASPAGRAFSAQIRELPPVLSAVADRYAAAAVALRDFASEFREAQSSCSLAITLRERGIIRRDRFAEAVAAAEASTSPAELARVATLRELMAQGAGEVLAAERAYLAATERFERADARCAGALRTLADDRLSDAWQYDAVKTAADLATSAASAASLVALVPVCRPAAGAVATTAGGLGLGLDAIVKVAYDEGEWQPIVEGVALSAVGLGAGSLRQAARARALPSRLHEGPVGFGSPARRLAAGARAQAEAAGPRAVRGPARAEEPAGLGPQSLRRRAQDALAGKVAAAQNDWRVATRNGADARAMLLTAWGLRAGAATYTTGKQVNDTYERAVLARDHLRNPSPERPLGH